MREKETKLETKLWLSKGERVLHNEVFAFMVSITTEVNDHIRLPNYTFTKTLLLRLKRQATQTKS